MAHSGAADAAPEPGFAGLRYRSGPACGVAASHPYNPSRPTGFRAFAYHHTPLCSA
ncbi:MAG: hypothetical protein LBK44_02940 [Spirochaetales bacterium]|nr:hypothetical protein [Spirochaetales bacterium]